MTWLLLLWARRDVVLAGLLVAALGGWRLSAAAKDRAYTELQGDLAVASYQHEVCRSSITELQSEIEDQNARVREWKTAAEAYLDLYQVEAAKPARTVYLDRVVEVPSAVSEDCETSVLAIKDVIGRGPR